MEVAAYEGALSAQNTAIRALTLHLVLVKILFVAIFIHGTSLLL